MPFANILMCNWSFFCRNAHLIFFMQHPYKRIGKTILLAVGWKKNVKQFSKCRITNLGSLAFKDKSDLKTASPHCLLLIDSYEKQML